VRRLTAALDLLHNVHDTSWDAAVAAGRKDTHDAPRLVEAA
jgi:hypothetical protein